MWSAFKEVMVDLGSFAMGRASVVGTSRPSSADLIRNTDAVVIEKSSNEVLDTVTVVGQTGYVIIDQAPYFLKPKVSIDSMVGRFNYGDKLTIGGVKNSFVKVASLQQTQGWLSENAVTLESTAVFPDLVSGVVYDVNNLETQKLRSYLHDEVLAGRLLLPLQSLEFVLYMLKITNCRFDWQQRKPRTPGSWQQLLRGSSGVSLGIEPRTGAVLEYAGGESEPFLAYVVAVHPDRSIQLQSVGRLTEGQYLDEVFSIEEWKKWRPIFVSFV